VEGQFTLIHGSPRYPIWEYVIYASTAQLNFNHFDTPFCFVGHTHTPVIFRLIDKGETKACDSIPTALNRPLNLGPERLIINPGSVGQPRDGNQRASYLILDDQALTIEYRRVEYDIDKTQAKMMEYDMPLRLVLRLGYGW
jgi:diadenosine tetraphosphatase ApaH/serine/threonine PP2A family protein phosphatase